MENIALLLGSGISLKSGFPDVNKITDTILSGENFGRHSDENYYFDLNRDLFPNYVANNILFIDNVKYIIDKYSIDIGQEHIANYEDIYYVINQIKDSEDIEFENPALKPLIDDLKNNTLDICSDTFNFKQF
jgi:hypothetical protein